MAVTLSDHRNGFDEVSVTTKSGVTRSLSIQCYFQLLSGELWSPTVRNLIRNCSIKGIARPKTEPYLQRKIRNGICYS
jgi:hypothetical protein